MTPSQRLRQLAGRTGLDGFADELRAMADEMDAAAPVKEPVAWMFQHGETGRMNYLSNDGMNSPSTFVEMNPRYALVCPLYTTPPAAQQQDARIAALEAEVGEQARLNGIGAERELALRAEVERLQRAITKFCKTHSWADDEWKALSNIKPLFDITRAIKAVKEAK